VPQEPKDLMPAKNDNQRYGCGDYQQDPDCSTEKILYLVKTIRGEKARELRRCY
jgi:hypothetical protein